LFLVSSKCCIQVMDWIDDLAWPSKDRPVIRGRQDQKVMYPTFVERASLQSCVSDNKDPSEEKLSIVAASQNCPLQMRLWAWLPISLSFWEGWGILLRNGPASFGNDCRAIKDSFSESVKFGVFFH
jgi:hypothetical protein